jgi:rare lipoprotein A
MTVARFPGLGARSLASLVLTLAAWLTGCAGRGTPGFNPPTGSLTSSQATPDDLAFARSAESPSDATPKQVGMATWYGESLAGHKTASGERFDPSRLTAAHRSLKLGTWVEVRRVDTGSVVRVRVNDRGPYGKDRSRVIDLSRAAAEKIGMIRDGVVRVELRVVPGP